jgi:GT2 family glycosyltransferase
MSSERQSPMVVAIVLNWCDRDLTAACLRSLEVSDYPELEILLVDNASPDGSGEALHEVFPHVPYLPTGANLGYTGGNNRGIEYALDMGAEYVLVINNDTEIAPDAVSRLVEVARANPDVGAVGPKILYHAEPERLWFAGGDVSLLRLMGRHWKEGQLDLDDPEVEPTEVTFLTGCCLLIRSAAIREHGPFREDYFTYMEDLELSIRLRAAGYRLFYEPAARLLHHVPVGKVDPSPSQIFFRDRNRKRIARAHLSGPERLRFLLFFYPSRIAHLMRYLVHGDASRLRATWQGMTAT